MTQMYTSFSERTETGKKTERFHVVAQEGINKYDLASAELAEYANEYCNKFISEKEIKEPILYDHLVPNNIQGINRLDSFMRDILKYKAKESLIESICEKVRQKTRDVYGPVSRMRSYLEEINSSRDETVHVDIDIFLTCT